MSDPTVKLGVDGNVIDLMSIGNVRRITRHPVKVDVEFPYRSEAYTPYRLELVEVPFWGRTLINEGEDAYLADLEYAYRKRQILSPSGEATTSS